MSVFYTSYKGIDKALDKGGDTSILELCIKITAEAKSLAPFDLGALRNSIMYKTNVNKGGFNDSTGEKATEEINYPAKKGRGVVGSNMEYAAYQEFGTRKTQAQPYLRPAVDKVIKGTSVRKTIADIMSSQLTKDIRAGKKVRL